MINLIKNITKGSPLDVLSLGRSSLLSLEEAEIFSKICEAIGFHMFLHIKDFCEILNLNFENYLSFTKKYLLLNCLEQGQISKYPFYRCATGYLEDKDASRDFFVFEVLFSLINSQYLSAYSIKKSDGQNIYLSLGQPGYTLLSLKHSFYNEMQLFAEVSTLERIVNFNSFMIENGLSFTKKIKQPSSHLFFICENNEIYYEPSEDLGESGILSELQSFVFSKDGSILDHNKLREKFRFNQIEIKKIHSLKNLESLL